MSNENRKKSVAELARQLETESSLDVVISLLRHETVTIRALVIEALVRLFNQGNALRVIATLREVALNPENQVVYCFGPPIHYLALGALASLGDSRASESAREVASMLDEVDRTELSVHLQHRGISL